MSNITDEKIKNFLSGKTGVARIGSVEQLKEKYRKIGKEANEINIDYAIDLVVDDQVLAAAMVEVDILPDPADADPGILYKTPDGAIHYIHDGDWAEINDPDAVSDVKVNGTSVVTDTVADLTVSNTTGTSENIPVSQKFVTEAFEAVEDAIEDVETALTAETTARTTEDARLDDVKADKATTYTKTETDAKLDLKANLADVYLKTQTYSQDEVDELLNQINTAEFAGPFATKEEIPTPYDTNDLYLVGTAQPYQIWIYIQSADELHQIGDTEVDFSEYRKAVDQDVIDAKHLNKIDTSDDGETVTGFGHNHKATYLGQSNTMFTTVAPLHAALNTGMDDIGEGEAPYAEMSVTDLDAHIGSRLLMNDRTAWLNKAETLAVDDDHELLHRKEIMDLIGQRVVLEFPDEVKQLFYNSIYNRRCFAYREGQPTVYEPAIRWIHENVLTYDNRTGSNVWLNGKSDDTLIMEISDINTLMVTTFRNSVKVSTWFRLNRLSKNGTTGEWEIVEETRLSAYSSPACDRKTNIVVPWQHKVGNKWLTGYEKSFVENTAFSTQLDQYGSTLTVDLKGYMFNHQQLRGVLVAPWSEYRKDRNGENYRRTVTYKAIRRDLGVFEDVLNADESLKVGHFTFNVEDMNQRIFVKDNKIALGSKPRKMWRRLADGRRYAKFRFRPAIYSDHTHRYIWVSDEEFAIYATAPAGTGITAADVKFRIIRNNTQPNFGGDVRSDESMLIPNYVVDSIRTLTNPGSPRWRGYAFEGGTATSYYQTIQWFKDEVFTPGHPYGFNTWKAKLTSDQTIKMEIANNSTLRFTRFVKGTPVVTYMRVNGFEPDGSIGGRTHLTVYPTRGCKTTSLPPRIWRYQDGNKEITEDELVFKDATLTVMQAIENNAYIDATVRNIGKAVDPDRYEARLLFPWKKHKYHVSGSRANNQSYSWRCTNRDGSQKMQKPVRRLDQDGFSLQATFPTWQLGEVANWSTSGMGVSLGMYPRQGVKYTGPNRNRYARFFFKVGIFDKTTQQYVKISDETFKLHLYANPISVEVRPSTTLARVRPLGGSANF